MPVLVAEDGTVTKDENTTKKVRRLDLSSWQLAIDRYLLAAAVTGQMTLAQGQKYKNMILECAFTEKKFFLGVCLDEVLRHVMHVY